MVLLPNGPSCAAVWVLGPPRLGCACCPVPVGVLCPRQGAVPRGRRVALCVGEGGSPESSAHATTQDLLWPLQSRRAAEALAPLLSLHARPSSMPSCWARPVSPLPGVALLLCCPSSACLQVSLHHSLALRVGLALAQGSMGPAGVVCVCGHVAVGGRDLPDRGLPSAVFCLEVILLLPNNPLNSGELWLPALPRVPRTGGRTARGPELLAPGTASHSVVRGYGCPRG